MRKWTQSEAEGELSSLVEQIPALSADGRRSAEHTRWLARTLSLLEEVFGRDSRYYLSIAKLPWHNPGGFMIGGPNDALGSYDPNAAIEREHKKALRQQLELAQGLLQAGLDELRRKGIEHVFHGKDTPAESSTVVKILGLAERQLRKVIRNVPDREREVQDGFENLLVGGEIEYSRETERIEYSSKTYTPDFTFRKVDLALEIKLCNRPDREKEMIAEINDDILAYRGQYGNIVFVVYDTGHIRDVDRFMGSIAAHDGVLIRVVKH